MSKIIEYTEDFLRNRTDGELSQLLEELVVLAEDITKVLESRKVIPNDHHSGEPLLPYIDEYFRNGGKLTMHLKDFPVIQTYVFGDVQFGSALHVKYDLWNKADATQQPKTNLLANGVRVSEGMAVLIRRRQGNKDTVYGFHSYPNLEARIKGFQDAFNPLKRKYKEVYGEQP